MIKYRNGYKYQLAEDFSIELRHNPLVNYESDFLSINISGVLTIKKGYAWDGPSGPTIDTDNSMIGALVHDALYQLMRERVINKSFRGYADYEAYLSWRKDGMSFFRARIWYRSVRRLSAPYADPSNRKVVLTAP